jgi:Thioredoxin
MAALLLLSVVTSGAHFARAQSTTVHDPAALKPPPGARVAIVEFEDMECPDCARANPLLRDAATQYHIPWVRHDFPLPFHAWSFDAAVYARWFDTKSKKLGDDFRDSVFANQQLIDAAG